MWETWVRSLGQEDPLEQEMATHSSTLAWKIPWMEEPGRLQSMGSQRVRHNWATSLSLFQFLFTFCHKNGVICLSEVSNISPGNFDSSLCFIQPRILHDDNKQGDDILPWHTPFPIWNLSIVPWSEVKSLSCVQLFATPWTVAYQAPQSMGFSRQEYWSGLPFPSPGDLPDPGIKPRSPM